MPSLIQGYEYDIFISYRHNDNRSGWVTEFVNALQEELAATIKEPLTIYFDKNPHDGLLETHNVDKSLEGKLKCLIFIPIISQTYCDPKSFAWQHEFCAFNKLSKEDQFGRDIKLSNGNVTSRILPIKIHMLDAEDTATIENEIRAVLRAIEFIHKSAGVNRPLTAHDDSVREPGKILYRDQVNKVANAVKEIIQAIRNKETGQLKSRQSTSFPTAKTDESRWSYKKIGITAVAALVLATVLCFLFLNKAETEEQRPLSIAVLPFRNTSSEALQQDYGIGLANEIRSKLSESKHFLFISSLQSTIAYMNSTESPVKIGSDLEVNYLLNGIYQLSGDRIKIDVELIDTQTGRIIWSLSFKEAFIDIFQIQSKIATEVFSQFTLVDKQTKQLPTENIEAYGHYLKAEQLYWGGRTASNLTEAADHANKAIQLDSSFLDPYVTLANVQSILLSTDGVIPNEIERALVESKLLSIAALVDQKFPNAWQKLRIHARIAYTVKSDYDEALRLFKEVLIHDPEDFPAHAYIGGIYKRKLMQREAIEHLFKARQLNPSRAQIWNEIGQVFFSMGNYSALEKSVDNAINLGHSLRYDYSEPGQTQFYFHSTGKKIPGTNLPLLDKINDQFFQRDFKGMNSTYDSVFAASKQTTSEGFYWKSVAYYMLQPTDSLKRYVNLILTDKEYKANGRTFILYAMIGDREKAYHVLKEYREEEEFGGQDTWGMANSLRDEVLLLSLLGDYAGATETLLKLNKTYPNFGDYEFIRVSPFFDKIKKEYLPFVDALNNLTLPARIPMEESMKL